MRLSIYTESFYWLALNLYHEARGEPFYGKVLVCHVVGNRVDDRDLTFKEIIQQDDQFSWYNKLKPPQPITEYGDDDGALESCLEAVEAFFRQRMKGEKAYGVDHYYSTDISPPSWSMHPKMIFVTQVGKHRFFRFDG